MRKFLPARIAGVTARHARPTAKQADPTGRHTGPTVRHVGSAGRYIRLTAAMAGILAATAASVIAIEATPARAASNDPVWIKSMTGSQDYGFHILWSDGTQTYTPTRSESIAECGEYDTRVERVACRATTRTEYRWMGLTKRSLRHAG